MTGAPSALGGAAGEAGGFSHDPFATLDQGTLSTAPTWVHAGAQHAEAGFEDPALGWVGVRADLSAGGVHAALVPGSAEAAATLGGHLAGLNAYLAERNSPVESVTLAAHGGMTQGNMAQGGHPDAQHGSHSGQPFGGQENSEPSTQTEAVAPRSERAYAGPVDASPGFAGRVNATVPVAGGRGGAHISVMA